MFETSVTAEHLADLMGRRPEDGEVSAALAEARELLTDATEDAFREIPERVRDDLVIRVARSCHENRTRNAHGSAPATQVGGETLVRSPRDPLAPVVGILARYVVPL